TSHPPAHYAPLIPRWERRARRRRQIQETAATRRGGPSSVAASPHYRPSPTFESQAARTTRECRVGDRGDRSGERLRYSLLRYLARRAARSSVIASNGSARTSASWCHVSTSP